MMQTILPLPTIQNWDCHTCGTCCKEYLVTVSPGEAKRIVDQAWTKEELGGLEPLRITGGWFSKKTVLNHKADGSCVFLDDGGRCKIHAKHGYDSKPLPCKLFPFILIPTGRGWSVGMRYACPSASASLGRPMPEHLVDLRKFAEELLVREAMPTNELGTCAKVTPPLVEGNPGLEWEKVFAMAKGLTIPLLDREVPLGLRMFRVFHLASDLRKAKLTNLETIKIEELCTILAKHLPASVTASNRDQTAKPNWIGRVLFRQLAAICLRKDHGPNRGVADQGRLALLGAAWAFVQGKGSVPKMHKWLPEADFRLGEEAVEALPMEVERIFERYYLMKLGSLQFCGPTFFNMPFWEGIDLTLLIYSVQMWLYRILKNAMSETEAAQKALSIVDDHYGFNRVLGTFRQRLAYQILGATNQIERLVAWYGR